MLLVSFWQVFVFLITFFIIKTSQEWGRTWYSPWKSKIEAKLHEESKFWRASKPLPNQSSMEGRESEKESNIQQFRNTLPNIRKLANYPRGVQAAGQRVRLWRMKFRRPCETDEFCNPLQNLPVTFRYFCTDSIRFLSQDILCNYLFSPCNQLKIFLDI